MLNSLFSAEITDYVGLRYASVSVSAAKADEKVLNELDKFLTKAENMLISNLKSWSCREIIKFIPYSTKK